MSIVRRLQELRAQEHECTVAIVASLVECHRTRAYVDQGCATMWSFLVEHLRYSNAAASRRHRAMQCAERFPEVLAMLRDHQVSLTSLSKVAALLARPDEARALLHRIAGRSQSEVEREVARATPVARPRERVRRTFVRRDPRVDAKRVPDAEGTGSLFETRAARNSARNSGAKSAEKAAGSAAENVAENAAENAATSAAEVVVLQFSVDAAQYAAFERARAIVSRKTGGRPSLEECFVEFLAFYLDKKSPRQRSAARLRPAREAPRVGGVAADASPNSRERVSTRRSRHIPAAVRDHVLLRDGQRCTFVSEAGHRCTATHDLQIDHVLPFARGGSHDPSNLRVLCGVHNRARASGGRTPRRATARAGDVTGSSQRE